MITASYQCGPRPVSVLAELDVLTDIDQCFWSQRRPLCPPDTILTVRVDAADLRRRRRTALGGRHHETRTAFPGDPYEAWQGQRTTLVPTGTDNHVIELADKALTIHAATSAVGSRIAVRVLRQITMRATEDTGARSLHAGAVVINDRAVLVGGRAGAGKTTMMLGLLAHGAAPMSSDRTMVTADRTTNWTGTAVPHAWRITPAGLAAATELADAWHAPHRGRTLADGKAELTPVEIAEAYGRTLQSEAPVAALIVVDRTTLPPIPNGAGLRPHIDFGPEDVFAEDWLGQRRHPRAMRGDDGAWWNALAESVPTVRVHWTQPRDLHAAIIAANEWVRR